MEKSTNKLPDSKSINKTEEIVAKLQNGDFDCIDNLKIKIDLDLVKKILIEKNKTLLVNLIQPGRESVGIGCQINPVKIYDKTINSILELVDVSENGKYALTISDNSTSNEIKVWDISKSYNVLIKKCDPVLFATLRGNKDKIYTAIIILNKYILSTGMDKKLILWDLNQLNLNNSDKSLEPYFHLKSKEFIKSIKASKCGRYVLFIYKGGSSLLDFSNIKKIQTITDFNYYMIDLTSDFNFAVTTNYRTSELTWVDGSTGMLAGETHAYGNYSFWSLEDKKNGKELKFFDDPAYIAAISMDDKLAFVGLYNGQVNIFNIENRSNPKYLANFNYGYKIITLNVLLNFALINSDTLYDISNKLNPTRLTNVLSNSIFKNSILINALLNSWIIDDLDILQIAALIRVFGNKEETNNSKKVYNSINPKIRSYLEDREEIKLSLRKGNLTDYLINIILLYFNNDIYRSYCVIC